jgi:hypothetical protein
VLTDAALRVLIPVLGGPLVLSIVRIWRGSRAHRRHQAIPYDITVSIPVRLRGADRRYPGLFRMGWFDQATGRWRPSWWWGAPVSLAGARERGCYPAADVDAVPRFLRKDVVLDCRDHHKTRFQLLVMEDDIPAIRLGMTKAPQSDTVGPWQRLQTLVRPSAALTLLCGLGWPALLLVPSAGPAPVGWIFGSAIAFWICGAALTANEHWYRRRLARTDRAAARQFDPVTPPLEDSDTCTRSRTGRPRPDLRV